MKKILIITDSAENRGKIRHAVSGLKHTECVSVSVVACRAYPVDEKCAKTIHHSNGTFVSDHLGEYQKLPGTETDVWITRPEGIAECVYEIRQIKELQPITKVVNFCNPERFGKELFREVIRQADVSDVPAVEETFFETTGNCELGIYAKEELEEYLVTVIV